MRLVKSCSVCGIAVFHVERTFLTLLELAPVQHHGPCGKLCGGGPTVGGQVSHTKSCTCLTPKKTTKATRAERFTG